MTLLATETLLAFDTCFNACSVAVYAGQGGDNAPVITQICEPMQRGHAERLIQMIEEVMHRAQLDFTDLKRLAVTTGPGSFTGTRVGVATARALAMASDLPLTGVSSLAVTAASPQIRRDVLIAPDTPATQLAVLVDARRDQVYAQLFSLCGTQAKSMPQLLSPAESAQIGGNEPTIFVGSGAKLIANLAIDAEAKTIVQAGSLQPNIGDYICTIAKLAVEPTSVRPLYMRPADAKPQLGKSIARA